MHMIVGILVFVEPLLERCVGFDALPLRVGVINELQSKVLSKKQRSMVWSVSEEL